MNIPKISFRDAVHDFPSATPIPVRRTLDPDERIRRIGRHETLRALLAELRPETDPDLWTCATYSELINFAVEALHWESARIQRP